MAIIVASMAIEVTDRQALWEAARASYLASQAADQHQFFEEYYGTRAQPDEQTCVQELLDWNAPPPGLKMVDIAMGAQTQSAIDVLARQWLAGYAAPGTQMDEVKMVDEYAIISWSQKAVKLFGRKGLNDNSGQMTVTLATLLSQQISAA